MSDAVRAYLERKKAQSAEARPMRTACLRCRKPVASCYCGTVSPIATDPRIVILIHPLEAKHPVGTGRMTHLCLENSEFWVGEDFSTCAKVNALLSDPSLYPVLLFPSPRSVNLSALAPEARREIFPAGRKPVLIVLDGTWRLAKKMLFHSPNLQNIPQLCFQPSRLSRFRVRKQPHEQCFSTIEAVHEVLSLLNPEAADRPHDHLLEVFDGMVEKQLSFRVQGKGAGRHSSTFLARKARREKWRALRRELRERGVNV